MNEVPPLTVTQSVEPKEDGSFTGVVTWSGFKDRAAAEGMLDCMDQFLGAVFEHRLVKVDIQ